MPKGISIAWNEKMDALLGMVPDKILAEFFGCSYVAVLFRRKKFGIKSYSGNCKGRTYEEKYGKSKEQFLKELRKKYPKYKKQTKEEIDYEEVSKYLSTHTNKQIAKMFEIADSSVSRIRGIYKIDSPKRITHKKSKKNNDRCFVNVMRHLGNLLEFVSEEGKNHESYKILVNIHQKHLNKKRKAGKKYYKNGQLSKDISFVSVNWIVSSKSTPKMSPPAGYTAISE